MAEKPKLPKGPILSEIPKAKAPDGEYLSPADILAIARDTDYRRDTPEGETPICAYCGAETKMPAYTSDGKSWPACCAKDECIDKWEPRRN